MEIYKVGDRFKWVLGGINILMDMKMTPQGDLLFTFDDSRYFFEAAELYRAIEEGACIKISGEPKCKHNFILYESFTDIFKYCTSCNEKRK